MKTKDKILETARELFNERGISNVSMRNIAEAMGISPGNLTYHFPSRDALLGALVQQLCDEQKDMLLPTGYDISFVINHIKTFHLIQERFSFFYTDLVEAGRSYPEFSTTIKQLVMEKQGEIRRLIDYYVEGNILISEPEEGMYDLLAENILIVNLYRLSHKIVVGNSSAGNSTSRTLAMLSPYFVPEN